MAKQYVVTEEEFHSLIESLQLADYTRPHKNRPDEVLTPEEANRLMAVHRHFHFYVVRWIQAMGCSAVRGGQYDHVPARKVGNMIAWLALIGDLSAIAAVLVTAYATRGGYDETWDR